VIVFLHLTKLGPGTLDKHRWHDTSIDMPWLPRFREHVLLPDPREGVQDYENWLVTDVVYSPPQPTAYPATDPRSSGPFVTVWLR
jgi:hypothetical protein